MGHFLCKPLEANIGQLKSDIQFICAQAWVIALNNSSSILRLDQTFISEPYKVSSEAKALLSRLFKDKNYLDINRIYTDELKLELITNKQLEDEDIFYAFITREYINLRNSNVSAQETSSIIKNKLKNIFDYGINYSLHNKTYIHSEEIEKRISQLVIYIESVLQFKLKDHFKNMLARHILTLLAYIQKGLIPQLYSSNLISEHCRDEYDNALLICKKIADIFYISCPTTEVVYWCLYLKECRIDQMRNHLPLDYQVIFIAHGDTTATSMANYIYRILEHELILAIDMPFEQSVHDTLHILTNLVEQYKVKKLLLIVDTGSLVYFGDVIHQKYDIDVLLVHNITMAALLDISLDLVYDSREFEQLKQLIQHKNIDYKICNTRIEQEEQVLMISCITGMGTALKIKNIIEESFHDLLAKITIKILDYNDIRSKEGSRQLFVEKPRVIGMIGTFQIGLPDIPFISLEELFSDQGPELVISLLAPQMNNEQKQIFLDKSAMKFIGALTLESIINQISVLNPKRIISEIESVYQFICQKLDITPTKQVTLRFLIHCSCMVERIVISHKPLQMVTIPNENRVNYILSVIKTAFLPIENSYSIQLSDVECFYIYELLYC